MNLDEALSRVRDPHGVVSMTDVELTEAAVTLAIEVERLRPIEARAQTLIQGEAWTTVDDAVLAAVGRYVAYGDPPT